MHRRERWPGTLERFVGPNNLWRLAPSVTLVLALLLFTTRSFPPSLVLQEREVVTTGKYLDAIDNPRKFDFGTMENNVVENSSSGVSSNDPVQCTEEQLSKIAQQLPAKKCQDSVAYPWKQLCSFTLATKCPDPIWLHEFHARQSTTTSSKSPFLSYFIGCNKAIDAVNALRMGSKNPKHDLSMWKTHLQKGREGTFAGSSCRQFDKDQVRHESTAPQEAQVHCFEPIPNTFAELNRTKQELGWGDELVLARSAFSSKAGLLMVPKVDAMVGVENKGIDKMMGECAQVVSARNDNCEGVPILTLDDYHQQHKHGKIHYLSVDVEGFDFLVLQGGMKVLKDNVQYLEFEYNWVGPWKQKALAEVIGDLDAIGFTCYWPGVDGNIWRITGCWLEHYSFHHWSNVACVSRNDREAASMVKRMEDLFHATLQKDIQYSS